MRVKRMSISSDAALYHEDAAKMGPETPVEEGRWHNIPTPVRGLRLGTLIPVLGSLHTLQQSALIQALSSADPQAQGQSEQWGLLTSLVVLVIINPQEEKLEGSNMTSCASSSCGAVHAKCRTWLLLHHSEHQPLQPSHYFGPWRSYSYVYVNPQPAGMAVDIAKDSSTPLKTGLLTGSAEPLHHSKHRDVLERA
ncbi:hypothetical protein Anapl_04117 [Anas platyrhynchos]|uniref:Uncharacterized protein n=1 Tax=Anas platyrhynchos TaxID=8839 RepID=R0LLH3_ANAPL|nr:hypothetical protein Anapl_04117 [Anas platyrhynchos]